MPTSRTASRAATTARTEVLDQLKEDHKRVKKAYRDFQKLDGEQDPESCGALVAQVLDELTVHAAVEEELLYPAARGVVDENLVDEAEVEHESLHALIDQLRSMTADDEKFAARFTVLCEYVLHHVKEEEGEMFPQLEKAKLDWESLAAEMLERREQLMGAEEGAAATAGSAQQTGDESDRESRGGRSSSRS
jgi:hemerythrin superfamily protein